MIHPSHTSFSYSKLFGKSISSALNVELLLLQGMTLVLSVLAFLVFTGFMGLIVYLAILPSLASGFLPVSVFVVLFGFAVWVLGMLAINAFVNGVQFHLAMQAVTKKPFDLNLAWKLSSARWRDAFVVQGSLLGFIVGLFVLSLIVSLLVSGNINVLSVLFQPANWTGSALATILVMGLLILMLQPFLMMMLPIVYFENTKPLQITQKLHEYVKPHYWALFGTLILLIILNVFLTSIADFATQLPATQSPVRETAVTFVIFTGFAFLVQILAILLTFTINLNTQTLLYLHVGKPEANTQFVTQGPLSTALSQMARSHPSHSGMLPVKWKTPGSRKGR